MIRFLYDNQIYDDKFTTLFEQGGMPQHVDLPRLKEGKNGGAFWSAFVPCPSNGSDFSDENYAGCMCNSFIVTLPAANLGMFGLYILNPPNHTITRLNL